MTLCRSSRKDDVDSMPSLHPSMHSSNVAIIQSSIHPSQLYISFFLLLFFILSKQALIAQRANYFNGLKASSRRNWTIMKADFTSSSFSNCSFTRLLIIVILNFFLYASQYLFSLFHPSKHQRFIFKQTFILFGAFGSYKPAINCRAVR